MKTDNAFSVIVYPIVFLLYFLTTGPGPIDEWQKYEVRVRDQKIEKQKAIRIFPVIYDALKKYCSKFSLQKRENWIFPVKNYGIKDVGKGGFQPDNHYGSSGIKGYDFFDGNLHGGHPAYDIFIHDKNHDSLDDRTEKPVDILAPLDLVILSVNTGWEKGSEIRGGIYIWAINPLHDMLFYFAHLKEVNVSAGSFCKAGTTLSKIGRTGKNAFPKRSPTHLHLMVLKVKKRKPVPFDYWKFLNY